MVPSKDQIIIIGIIGFVTVVALIAIFQTQANSVAFNSQTSTLGLAIGSTGGASQNAFQQDEKNENAARLFCDQYCRYACLITPPRNPGEPALTYCDTNLYNSCLDRCIGDEKNPPLPTIPIGFFCTNNEQCLSGNCCMVRGGSMHGTSKVCCGSLCEFTEGYGPCTKCVRYRTV